MSQLEKTNKPSVEKGDHVYFNHKEHGPLSGEILAHGHHGLTIKGDNDKHHKVYWDNILGHKQRMEQQFSMVDKGEDGSIVEDEKGKRRYIEGEIPEATRYQDKVSGFQNVEDGDLITRRIDKEMQDTSDYQVLADSLPEGNVLAGTDKPKELLQFLEKNNLQHEYEVIQRTVVSDQNEVHSAIISFSVDETEIVVLVNAIAAFQRKSALDTDEIIVIGEHVNEMEQTVLSHKKVSGKTVIVIGEKEGFESIEVSLSSDMVNIMSKSIIPDGSKVLFFKADQIKNKAGLSLQSVTDKAGHQTKRWKKTSQDEPVEKKVNAKDPERHESSNKIAKQGDMVLFEVNGKKLPGKVVAAGEDGITATDKEGNEHQVYWDDVKKDNELDKDDTGAGDVNSLFTKSEIELPKLVVQKGVTDVDSLFELAEKAMSEYKGWLSDLSHKENWHVYDNDFKSAVHGFKAGEKGIKVIIAKLKGKDRAIEKAETSRHGFSSLLDIVRGTVAVDHMDDLPGVLNELRQSGMKIARKPKNRFAEPTGGGYRDIMLNIELPNGHIAELQVNTKAMLLAKAEGHKHYEEIRPIEEKAEAEGRSLTIKESSFVDKKNEIMRGIYKKGWDISNGIKLMTKSMFNAIICFVKGIKK